MKPYYQDDAVTIYHGDCREFVKEMPICGLVLTDWPYAVEESYASYNDRKGALDILIDDIFTPLRSRSDLVAMTVGVANMWRYPQPTWTLSWISTAGCGSGPWGFCCWQPILVYGKDPYLSNGLGRQRDIIESNESSEKNGHPCPKPIGLWKKVMQRVSLGQSLVFDPFMGSGTTLRAAKDLGRKAIGIEIEEKYCEIAARRMEQEVLPLNDASNLRTEVSDTASLFQ